MKLLKHFIAVRFLWAIFFISPSFVYPQKLLFRQKIKKERLLELRKKIQERNRKKQFLIDRYTEKNDIPVRQELPDGSVIELVDIRDNGHPVFYMTHNISAATTVYTHDLWSGPYNLSGNGMIIGEWDAGAVLSTHQEFGSRVIQRDGASTTHEHATHVAGTLIASGVEYNAHGMAYEASLYANDWNSDEFEMIDEALNGLLISNHSYGTICGWYDTFSYPYWYGDPDVDPEEDYQFGFYDYQAEWWDEIAHDAPYYLIVKSAGNDRNDSQPAGTEHKVSGLPGTFTDYRKPDGPYDCIGPKATAKNILTVGAVEDDRDMSSFSCWGPTDDGRIKPDICGVGVNLYSANDSHNTSYTLMSGTSMASPNVAGSLLLLQELYQRENGHYMLSSTLKGLAIHTTDDVGRTGPDYSYGWGVLNAKRAANLIIDASNNNDAQIKEYTLQNGETKVIRISSDGISTLRVTICWTDPQGNSPSIELDPSDLMLINDLDLRLDNGNEYQPYVLNPLSPSTPATIGDNFRDNVEQVYIANPDAGDYTISISHKSTLTNPQDFSLILSGAEPSAKADFMANYTVAYTGQEITFSDNSLNPSSWSWDFGAGASPVNANTQGPHLVSYSTPGYKTVSLEVNGGGGIQTNTKTDYILVLPTESVPYTNDFESVEDKFASEIIDGNINFWEKGIPTNTINNAYSGQNVWKTDLDADISTYGDNHDIKCGLYTPLFDFSQEGTYYLKMRYRMEVAYLNAPLAVWVEYSTDKGVNWQRLGQDGYQHNWYNCGPDVSSDTYHSTAPDGICWSGSWSNYKLASYDLSFLAGHDNMAFRIVAFVEGGWSGFAYLIDGFSVDDFEIDYSKPVSLPYAENFESDDGNFIPYELHSWDSEDSWELATTILPKDGFPLIDGNAWVTNLESYHGANCEYVLELPPFTLKNGIGDYTFSFEKKQNVHETAGLHVQYSVDNGQTWQILGDLQGSDINAIADWYNNSQIDGLNSYAGWTGLYNPSPLFNPQYDITFLNSYDNIRFRFVFGASIYNYHGFVIDNIAISGKPTQTFISVSDVTVTEMNTGTANAVFTMSLSTPVTSEVSVDYSTSDNTATEAGNDYSGIALSTLTFEAFETITTVSVPVHGDVIDENDESFYLDLSNPVNAGLADSRGECFILDDDGLPGISNSDVAILEGNTGLASASFTVSLTNPSSFPVSVDYKTMDNTALVSDNDYNPVSAKTLTFDPHELKKIIQIEVVGDEVYEDIDEEFFVQLDNPVFATIDDNQAICTIIDDDTEPVISIDDVSVPEGNTGLTNAYFTVTLSNPSASVIYVNIDSEDNTAKISENDYNQVLTTQMEFLPKQTTHTITAEIIGDNTFEADEQFTINLSAPVNASISQHEAICTIENDDNQPEILVDDISVNEGNTGTAQEFFTLTLSNPSAFAGSVGYKTTDNTATVISGDYEPLTTSTLDFAPLEVQKKIQVSVFGDDIYEPDEDFYLDFSNPVNLSTPASSPKCNILNDDFQPFISAENISVVEGDAGTVAANVSLTLSNPSAYPVSLDYSTVDHSANSSLGDYDNISSKSLVFESLETIETISAVVNGDLIDEANPEKFLFHYTNPSEAQLAEEYSTVSIIDDDAPPEISINDVSGNEGNSGQQDFVFELSLSSPSEFPVSVLVTSMDNTATEVSGDYESVETTVTFAPLSTKQSFIVRINGDNLYEGDNETFHLVLSDPENATILDNTGIGEIIEDDSEPELFISDVEISEGNTGTAEAEFTVSLSNPCILPVDVTFETRDYSASAGDNDYAAIPSTVLTFAPLETKKIFPVTIIGDVVYDGGDEDFYLDLSNPVNASIGKSTGVCTILEDETYPEISSNDIFVSEGNTGFSDARFTVNLTTPSKETITVTYVTTDGTAKSPDDYTSLAPDVLTFDPLETEKYIQVPVKGDDIYEGTEEAFSLGFLNPENALMPVSEYSCVILEDETPPQMSIGSTTVVEGDTETTAATVQLSLSHQSELPVIVFLSSVDKTAQAGKDFIFVNDSISFSPYSTTKNYTSTVLGDDIDENVQEEFILHLYSPHNSIIAQENGTVTIQDNDDPPALLFSDISVTEGNSGQKKVDFELTLSNPSAFPVSFDFKTSDNTALKSEPDYQGISLQTMVIDPLTTKTFIQLKIFGDKTEESDIELFYIDFSNPLNMTLPDNQAEVGILDNDDPPVISVDDIIVNEGNSGTSVAKFKVTLSNPSAFMVSLDYKTTDGTATVLDNDYMGKGLTTLNFSPLETSKEILVDVIGDTDNELIDEVFSLDVSNPVNSSLSGSRAMCTIFEDDAPLVINFGSKKTTKKENAGLVNIQVTLSRPTVFDIHIPFSVSGDASSPNDYTISASPLIIEKGSKKGNIEVILKNDRTHEADEYLILTLRDPSPIGVIGSKSTHKLNILNEDPPRLKADKTNNTTNVDIDITFRSDSIWESNITQILINGSNAEGQYTVSPGVITFDGSLFPVLRNYHIEISASGYHDALLTQPINKEKQYIEWEIPNSITYGDPYPRIPIYTSSGLPITYEIENEQIAIAVDTTLYVLNVGETKITASNPGNDENLAVNETKTFKVFKRQVKAIPYKAEMTYGSKSASFYIKYEDLGYGEDGRVIDIRPEQVLSVDNKSNAGIHTNAITLKEGWDNNYYFTYGKGDVTIKRALLKVTADDQEKKYGDAIPEMTVSYSGFKNGETERILTRKPIIQTHVNKNTPVGNYRNDIVTSGAEAKNYYFEYYPGDFRVKKSSLTFVADKKTKTYGASVPKLTYQVKGFLNGDDISVIDIMPKLQTKITNETNTGYYEDAISFIAGYDNNYYLHYVSNDFEVTKAPLKIIADNQYKAYGKSNPELTISYQGFVKNENKSHLEKRPEVYTDITVKSDAGFYEEAIIVKGASDDNYEIIHIPGNFTIHKARLTFTAEEKLKTYGEPIPQLTMTYSGFIPGEGLSNIEKPVLSCEATESSPAGKYLITFIGGQAENYSFKFKNGTLTVNKALLKASAKNQEKTYGKPNPEFPFTIRGFVNGDTEDDITLPSTSCEALPNSETGTYLIYVSGGKSANYNFGYQTGYLTVKKRELIISAKDKTRKYGQPNPKFTFLYDGFIEGDNKNVLEILPYAKSNAIPSSPAGEYYIRPQGAKSNNYKFTYQDGVLTIVPDVARLSTWKPDFTGSTIVKIKGSISSDGGDEITEKGFYWSTSKNPELTGEKVILGTGGGPFENTFSHLTPSTKYYFTAYAFNSAGISFGSIESVKTGPVKIILSKTNFNENLPAGTNITQISTKTDDPVEKFTYTFVNDNLGADNQYFAINSNTLVNLEKTDYEHVSEYQIHLQSTDENRNTFKQPFLLKILNQQEAPYNFQLTGNAIDEKAAIGTTIGIFSVSDDDEGDSHTYSIRQNGENNAPYSIDDATLLVDGPIDFETQSHHQITVRATDKNGLFVDKKFDIQINDLNEAPYSITLSDSVIQENEPARTWIGDFYIEDPDINDQFSIEFRPNEENILLNDIFIIKGEKLHSGIPFNFEEQHVYQLRVSAIDKGGESVESDFNIHIKNVNDPPYLMYLEQEVYALVNQPYELVMTDSLFIDEDGDLPLSYIISVESGQELLENIEIKNDMGMMTVKPVMTGEAIVNILVSDSKGETSEASVTIHVVDKLPVSVNKNEPLSILMYPNPSDGKFRVLLQNSSEPVEISIRDISGKLLLNRKLTGDMTSFDISRFSQGIYLVEFRLDGYSLCRKLIISE
jgi:hypothetical protein